MYQNRREFVRTMAAAGVTTMASVGTEVLAESNLVDVHDVSNVLAPIRTKHDLPALAAAVYYQGSTIASGVTGVRKYGDPTPAKIDDQFHLGSCTKSMTATLAAILVEENDLDWKAPLSSYFPEMGNSMATGLRKVTLAHLACHRSGITGENWLPGLDFYKLHDLPGSFREQREVYAHHVLKEEPIAELGARFIYSNRNFALLGIVAERVANEEWEALITRRLYKPLGMKTAGFQSMGSPGKIDEPWQHGMDGKKHVPVGPGRYSDNPEVLGPAATVHCSVTDWLKYAAAHAHGEAGGTQFVTADSYKYLHTPQFGGNYAFGWNVTQRGWGGGTVLTHSGSNTWNLSLVWVAPLRDFAFVVATNQGPGGAAAACDEVAAAMIATFLT